MPGTYVDPSISSERFQAPLTSCPFCYPRRFIVTGKLEMAIRPPATMYFLRAAINERTNASDDLSICYEDTQLKIGSRRLQDLSPPFAAIK